MSSQDSNGGDGLTLRRLGGVLVAWCLLWGVGAVQGQSTVATLSGGPTDANPLSFSGNADGDTFQAAQFNLPGGLTLDVSGSTLFLADTLNGSVRRLDLVGGRTTTFVTGLSSPVDVHVDASTNVFVLTAGDGLIRQYDQFGNLTKTVNAVAFVGATSFVGDSAGDFYVVETGGAVKKVTGSTGAVAVVPVAVGTITSATGVAVLENGRLAVSDAGKHAIWSVDPGTGAASLIAGVPGTAGGVDGALGVGLLNAPRHLAQGGGDSLVVADSGNHAVRVVTSGGALTRLYGVPTSSWVSDYPGWEDGASTTAESREPTGVAVDGGGVVYVTEQFYHLVRTATGTGLSGPSGTGSGGSSGGSVTLNPPSLSFSPSSGYFPLGQTITVLSSSTNVFYTTDGSAPTTNSLPVAMTNGVGSIKWKNPTSALTALRVGAFVFSGTNAASTNVSGTTVTTNSIGVPAGLNTNLVGGVGATVLAPVVVNLPPGGQLKTLGFRLEVAADGGAPIIGAAFTAVSVTTNDFIPVVTSDGNQDGAARFTVTPYSFATTRGLSINFIGTNANLSLGTHAVVAMVAIPIPAAASVGDSYTIRVINPAGTSDTSGTDVLLNEGEPRKLVVSNIPYLVGDSSPAGWYNAGDFGNSPDGSGAGQLLLSDVNNAFNASVGIRPPYPFTDVFNAMDVFPEDAPGTVGGDGQIRFLDWQIILLRQQHLNTNPVFGISQTNWFRSWSATGVRTAGVTNLNTSRSASSLGDGAGDYPGRVWERQALMVSGGAENVLPGNPVAVPVHVRIAGSAQVNGLQFRVVVEGVNGAPSVGGGVQFNPVLSGARLASGAPNEVAVAWDIGQLDLAPGSSNLLGHIQFTVPGTARHGHCYRIALASADGSPDYTTQYEFETRAGCIWVGTSAPVPVSLISDEWRQSFFAGALESTGDAEDADGDGFANLLEYLAGTNPTNAQSLLRLRPSTVAGDSLEFVSAPGKRYVLECRDAVQTGGWQTVSTNWGTGQTIQFPLSNEDGTRFYRLRVDP